MYLSIFDTGNVSRETMLITIFNWYLLLVIRLFLSTFSRCPFFRLFFALYLPFFRVFTTYYKHTPYHNSTPLSTISQITLFFDIFLHFSTFFKPLRSTQTDTFHLSNFYSIRHFSTFLTYSTLYNLYHLFIRHILISFDITLHYTIYIYN